MKYEAEQLNPVDWRVRSGVYPNLKFINGLTETQARVFAFALNSVAEGKPLAAQIYMASGQMGDRDEYEFYDGPTDL